MGKALMVGGYSTGGLVSPWTTMLTNRGTANGSEVAAQYEATEAATFTNLGWRITGGGSGTNTLRFRVNAADGNLVAVITGTGLVEDAVHSDVLSAGDLFNLAETHTGTSPTNMPFVGKANVEFSSGHGSFHGAGTIVGIIYDVASSTRIYRIGGPITC